MGQGVFVALQQFRTHFLKPVNENVPGACIEIPAFGRGRRPARIPRCSRWPDVAALLPELRAAAHHGPALATTVNDRLDYFGTTLQQTLNLLRQADSRALTLTNALASDPEVMSLLRDRVPVSHIEVTEMSGPGLGIVLKVKGH